MFLIIQIFINYNYKAYMIKLKSLLQEQTTLFKQGMRDPNVGTKEGPIAKIQQKLIDAGIMNPIPDTSYGHYGPKTAAAVIEISKKTIS
jgi:hypothetical protein